MIAKNKKSAYGLITDLQGYNFCTIIVKCGKKTFLHVKTPYSKNEMADTFKINTDIQISDSGCSIEISSRTSKFLNEKYGVYSIVMGDCKSRIIGHNNLNMIGKEIYG